MNLRRLVSAPPPASPPTRPIGPLLDRTATLARLELLVTGRLDGLVQGDFLGTASGPGSDPADAREYHPGDDARRIDWSLTARTAALQVRRTVADRELETWLVADRSASLDFGTTHQEKRDVAMAALAAFGLRGVGNGNRVGLIIAGGSELVTFPARPTRVSLMAALTATHGQPRRQGAPSGSADLAAALLRAERTARRRGRVVVISDFLDQAPWPAALRRLSLRHQVVAVQVVDPREFELPAVGMLGVIDPETGRVLHVQTNSAALRDRYVTAAAERHAAIGASVRGAGADHLVLSTDRDWVLDMARFLTRRTPNRTALSSVSAHPSSGSRDPGRVTP